MMSYNKQRGGKSVAGKTLLAGKTLRGCGESSRGAQQLVEGTIINSITCLLDGTYSVLDTDWLETFVNAKCLAELFPRQVFNYMRLRPGKCLYSEDALLMDLTKDNDDESGAVGQQAPVQRLALASDSWTTHETGMKHILRGGEPGKFYSSSEGWGGSLDVSKGWFEIDFYTLDVRDVVTNRKVSYNVVRDDKGQTIDIGGGTPAEALDNVYLWCKKRPGHVLGFHGPGDRDQSMLAKTHLVPELTVPFQSCHGACLWTSLLNGAAVVRGNRESCEKTFYVASKDLAAAKCMGHLAACVQRHMPDLQLQRLFAADGTARRSRTFPLWAVCGLPEGVYLVRLIGQMPDGAPVDHVIAVDTDTELIWDGAEKNPMRLSVEALECCVGDGAKLSYVREVRQIFPNGRKRKTSNRIIEKKRKSRVGKQIEKALGDRHLTSSAEMPMSE